MDSAAGGSNRAERQNPFQQLRQPEITIYLLWDMELAEVTLSCDIAEPISPPISRFN